MAKIRMTENKLKQIIRHSINNILNEESLNSNGAYTLPQILSAIGYDFNRYDPQVLYKRFGTSASAKPGAWVEALKKIGQTGLAKNIENSILDQTAVNAGVKKATENPDADVKIGANGRYTNEGNLFSQIMQYAGGLASTNKGGTYYLRDFLQSAQNAGLLKGQTAESVAKTIINKIKYSGLKNVNPKAYNAYAGVLNDWINNGRGHKISEISRALAAFGQVLNNSRNDMPVVRGFQRLANLFGVKDANGRPLGVDGIIGQNTSAALKDNGFKDIFDFKDTLTKVQAALGIADDGIAGNGTIEAFQKAGINSFKDMRTYIRAMATREKNANMGKLGPGANLAAPGVTSPQNQGNSLSLAENRKIKITESELKQIIRESVENVINEDFDARMGRQARRRQDRAQNAWNNYQTVYNDPNATDAQKERARRNYYRKNLRNGVGNLQRAQEAEKQLGTLNKQVEDLKTTNTQLSQELETTKAALTKTNATVGQLTKANQTLTGQNKNLNNQLQLAQKKLQNSQTPATQPKLPTGQAVAQAPQSGLAPPKSMQLAQNQQTGANRNNA